MATYTKEEVKGRVMHLLRVDGMRDGKTMYLDASKRVKDAERDDYREGYKQGGPRMGQEIEKARVYADYVGEHAKAETLYNFFCDGYFLFTDRAA